VKILWPADLGAGDGTLDAGTDWTALGWEKEGAGRNGWLFRSKPGSGRDHEAGLQGVRFHPGKKLSGFRSDNLAFAQI